MKRSGPPKRKTPMKRTAMKAAPYSRPGVRPRVKGDSLDSDDWQIARAATLRRDKDCCQAVKFGYDRYCSGGLHVHHRKMRSQGGTHDIENLVTVCRAHHDLIHLDPLTAYRNGALVKSWDEPTEDWRA